LSEVELLQWLEATDLSVWIRESSSLWAYPAILIAHTIGLGYLVGINAAVDLRLLGLSPGLPIEPLRHFFKYIWWGFWINAISGVLLVTRDPVNVFRNPAFPFKMALIALAILVLFRLSKAVRSSAIESGPVAGRLKLMAALSVVCWLGAIVAGRLMAYVAPRPGLG
jgi:hypothetical protein